jgi:hypothetical protein
VRVVATSSTSFLFEAMTLTGLGGVIGVLLACRVSYVIMFFLPQLPCVNPALGGSRRFSGVGRDRTHLWSPSRSQGVTP